MKQTYNFRPSDYDTVRSTGIFTTVIRLDIREYKDEEEKTMWECEEVEYNHREPLTEADYGPLVSTLIRSKYSEDSVEAIVNNYLTDTESTSGVFADLQAWRTRSKIIANAVVKGEDIPTDVYAATSSAMQKVYGAEERHDSLTTSDTGLTVLIYGYGEDEEGGYDYRHTFTERPSKEEVLKVITDKIDRDTDQRILTGFVWHGMDVWLSTENQFNFKAAYDIAAMTDGSNLPLKMKIGGTNDRPNYFTFEDVQTLSDFFFRGMAHINATLNEGWKAKDEAMKWVNQQYEKKNN